MSENIDRIWTTFGTTVSVTNEPADVLGAALTLSGDAEEGGFSIQLTVSEALLLAEMLSSNVREVAHEVGL